MKEFGVHMSISLSFRSLSWFHCFDSFSQISWVSLHLIFSSVHLLHKDLATLFLGQSLYYLAEDVVLIKCDMSWIQYFGAPWLIIQSSLITNLKCWKQFCLFILAIGCLELLDHTHRGCTFTENILTSYSVFVLRWLLMIGHKLVYLLTNFHKQKT